ncbi:MAG: arginase [Bacteroidetes bacterium]|nr:arginase [Bacteroidota bacterium]
MPLNQKKLEIIKAASELGAGKSGARKGPEELLHFIQNDIPELSNTKSFEIQNFNTLKPAAKFTFANNIDILTKALSKVSDGVEHSLKHGYFPLIFTGDHSNAIGTISGFASHFKQEKIGVLWVDAHLDLHSPFTTPSGNIHGMALNALVGNDNLDQKKNEPNEDEIAWWQNLKHLGSANLSPKILPQHIVYIGIRSFEKEEKALADQLNIKVYTPEDIRKIGMPKVLENSLQHLQNCDKIYVSFDVDSLDTTISKGTGTPVDGGLTLDEARDVFQLLHHPKIAAFEITEINPDLEENNAMIKAVDLLLRSAFQSD